MSGVEDIAAWIVLTGFYVFVAIPAMADEYTYYKSLALGIALHLMLLVIFGLGAGLILILGWAFKTVLF
jgi:hypothetical protein